MSLKSLVKAASLPITIKHEKWLTENANPVWSPKALKFANEQLAGHIGSSRFRVNAFRASGAGRCKRERIFKRLYVLERDRIEGKTSNIFLTGSFLHLKWQMSGLTAGWLKEAEVPVDNPELDLTGTLDGILYDDSGFEFKSINTNGFRSVNTYGPKYIHKLQATAYMILKNLNAFSFVYEDKDSGEWREFRFDRDDAIVDEVIKELKDLNEAMTTKTLPPMLPKCISMDSKDLIFRGCPFREICPTFGEEGGWVR